MSPIQKKSSSSVLNVGNEKCPSCDRHFGPKAYDRHVEWCKERQCRIQKSPANVQLAKERLEARIKYRVPPLNKSKRLTTKEKYSPLPNRAETSPGVTNTKNTVSLERTPSVRKPKTAHNLSRTIKETSNVHKQDKVLNGRKSLDNHHVPKDTKKTQEDIKK